jgi:hypothetical protein
MTIAGTDAAKAMIITITVMAEATIDAINFTGRPF